MRVRGSMLLVLLGGCTPVVAEEFPRLATGAEVIAVTGRPAWQSGTFRIGTDSQGHVRRRALGREEGVGLDLPETREAIVTRYGAMEVTASGPNVGYALAAACRYDRQERRQESGALTVAEPTLPLLLGCTLMRDGQPAGTLQLRGAPERVGWTTTEGRVGEVRMGETRLGIASLHRAGRVGTVDAPLAYRFSDASGPVGGVQTNGAARIALPRDPAQRDAALAAGLVLALFWDPGDTD